MATTKKYKVLHSFIDTEDSDYVYKENRKFPRGNKKVDKLRVEELLTANNAFGQPLIEELEDE